jgi:membrane-associated phospholipid phosphatase
MLEHVTFIKLIADGLVVPIVLIGAYVLLFKVPKNKRFEAYARILMAGLTAYLIAKLLAAAYQPSGERPFELMGVAPGAAYLNNPGFPSDHALFTAAITFAVWFETRMKKTSILLAVLTIAVCIGRVLALVHTPLDVTGGIVVAAIGALWYLNRPLPVGHRPRKAHG